jgi:hypothetical protein
MVTTLELPDCSLHSLADSRLVVEAEKNWTTNQDGTPAESHQQKEQLVIDNPNDPLSSVTHRLEDIHVTVENATSTPSAHHSGQLADASRSSCHVSM